MKGFTISLDATIALAFIMFAMIIIASQFYNPRAPGGVYLKQLTLDTLSVMEKTGRIDQVLAGNSSGLSEILEATPILACMEIYLLNDNGDVVFAMTKTGCDDKIGLDIQVTASPVIYQSERYILRSESWFRKEPDT